MSIVTQNPRVLLRDFYSKEKLFSDLSTEVTQKHIREKPEGCINFNFEFCLKCVHACIWIMLKFANWFLTNIQIYMCVYVTCIFTHWFFSLIHSLQGSAVEVTTTNDDGKQYSDGKWHEIIAIRHQDFGQITLDGKYTGKIFFDIYEGLYWCADVTVLFCCLYLFISSFTFISTQLHLNCCWVCLWGAPKMMKSWQLSSHLRRVSVKQK